MSCRGRHDDAERDLTWIGGSSVRDLSADGQTMIFNESLSGAESGVPSVFRRNLDGGPAIRLGLGQAHALSTDGKSVLTLRDHQWSVLPVGAGSARTLEKGPLTAMDDGAWLPDGNRIVFNGTEGQPGRWRIYIQDTRNGLPRAITPQDVELAPKAASPDGLNVLGHTDSGWFLYPIDATDARPVRGLIAGDEPLRWSTDGRALYAASRTARLVTSRDLVRIEVATGTRHIMRTLAPADLVGVDNIGTVAITPDGNTYCYTYLRRLGALFLVDGLK
jgi:Tol biopolymer transport system component